MTLLKRLPLIRPSGTFSREGRRRWSRMHPRLQSGTLLPSREKVDRAQRETDEGEPLAPALTS